MSSLTDNALLRKIAKAVGAGGPGQDVEIVVDGLATEAKQDSQISLLELLGLRPILDPNNSTATLLNAGGVFTGTWTDVSEYPSIRIAYASNVAGVLQYQFSQDGVNVIQTIGFTSIASRSATITRTYRYFRIVYTNGGSNQTRFNLDTFLEPVPLTSVSVSSSSDTELTAPLTLSDAIANPTVPLVGSAVLYWDGSEWARSQIDVYLNSINNDVNAINNKIDSTFWPTQTKSDMATNDIASVTFSASANRRWVVDTIAVSFSEDPASAVALTITSSGADTFDLDFTKGGAGPFPVGWLGAVSQSLVVSLAAGGTGIVGKLNVSARLL